MKTVRMRRGLRIALAATLLVGLGGACAQIGGIEERTFDGTDGNTSDADCEAYCALVEGEDNDGACPQNYTTLDVCLGVCEKLPPGDPDEPGSENSIACRTNAAKAAKTATDSEKSGFCQAAGPGGNGLCGSNCEAYCMLVEREDVCGEILSQVPDCVEKCEAFGDSMRFDVGNSPTVEMDHSGDTVQCRIVHVSTAAKKGATDVDKETHCPHADFHSSLWCVDDPPTCSRYCDVEEVACQGQHSLYENRAQCEAACEELELGEVNDSTDDTIACRTYHAVSSLSDPGEHCAHAGPTGDGHCGHDVPADEEKGTPAEFAACRPYCRLLEAACPTEFGGAFSDGDDCVEQCDASDESFGAAADQEYSVNTARAAGDTLICRTFYAVKALGDVPNAAEYCPSAFGDAPCD
jgi:hypothetical protein